MERWTWGLCLPAVIGVMACGAIPSEAIEVRPTPDQIGSALARGRAAADERRSPNTFYARFGAPDGSRPGGFLITKLGSLSVMATHMALRGVEPSEAEIQQIIEAPTMLITIVIFGESQSFATDSYMVLDQGAKTIKPVTVRVDGRADRNTTWPESPRYKAKVVASFNYEDFDQKAKTIITVFPPAGGTASFVVDFSDIP